MSSAYIVSNTSILKSAVKSLRRAMQNLNFGLDNTFCDTENLKKSKKKKLKKKKKMQSAQVNEWSFTQLFLTSEG